METIFQKLCDLKKQSYMQGFRVKEVTLSEDDFNVLLRETPLALSDFFPIDGVSGRKYPNTWCVGIPIKVDFKSPKCKT